MQFQVLVDLDKCLQSTLCLNPEVGQTNTLPDQRGKSIQNYIHDLQTVTNLYIGQQNQTKGYKFPQGMFALYNFYMRLPVLHARFPCWSTLCAVWKSLAPSASGCQ